MHYANYIYGFIQDDIYIYICIIVYTFPFEYLI